MMNRWNRKLGAAILAVTMAASLTACGGNGGEPGNVSTTGEQNETAALQEQASDGSTDSKTDGSIVSLAQDGRALQIPDDNYRTYYELFVYSFYDSDGDGIGDLQGILEKLDYLNDGDDTTDTDLGINGIWLMPVMPSTTYHKYDTTDYENIDPQYGTLETFQELLSACHDRGIRVILDLAMNHSSSRHSWFLQATEYLKNLPEGAEPDTSECPYVDYYHFSREYQSGSVQLNGTDWYYEARFWDGMPDLNLQNEAVRREFEQIADFWLDMGVDGFRLDAVKEYVTGSTKDNVEILSWFADYVHGKDPENYLVCECWTEQNTYAKYYESGVDSMFDFAFADKSGIIANVVNGKASAASYAKNLEAEQTIYAQYNEDYINAPFYTNHDMGRSAGYYAGENSAAQTKMGNALNLLMNGNAFLYYGEELGMKGSGKDENKRAPMYWSKDSNAEGMCKGPADMEDFQMKFDSLEEQQEDADSIYNYVKQVIRVRNQNPAIARGTTTYLEQYSGEQCFALTRTYEDSTLLLLGNTSAEAVTVDLTGLTVGKTAAEDLVLLGELYTGEETAERTGTEITLPAYSILILGEE